MARQLEHLLSLIDSRPDISVQVLPSTASHNPAPGAGLILLRLGASLHPVGFLPVAYGPSTYLDDPTDTERLARGFKKVQQLAMGPKESRTAITRVLNGT